MNLIFAEQDWEDYLYWQKQDRKVLNRINQFIPDCMRAPYVGIGKPEPLKHAFADIGRDALPVSTGSSTRSPARHC